jgi:hypothetical protein
MAVATRTETLEPLAGSRPGNAALPVCDAAMSVHALGPAAFDFFIVQAAPRQFKSVNNDLNQEPNLVSKYP